MLIDKSVSFASSSFWLAIVMNVVVADEISTLRQEIVFANDTKEASIAMNDSSIAEASILPIKSRIIDQTISSESSSPQNSTSRVTLTNDRVDVVSTTTKLPIFPSLGDYATSKIMDFKPSVHIGEIEDYGPRKTVNERESLKNRVKFDDTVRIDESFDTDRVRGSAGSYREGEQDSAGVAIVDGMAKVSPVKFFETDGSYGVVNLPIEIVRQQENSYERNPQFYSQIPVRQVHEDHRDDDLEDTDHDSHRYMTQKIPIDQALVTFEYPRSSGYLTVTSRPMTLERPAYPSIMSEYSSVPHHYQYHKVPEDTVHASYAKPSKFHDTPGINNSPILQHYVYVTPMSIPANIDKPEAQVYRQNRPQKIEYQQKLPIDSDTRNTVKPDTVLYLTSHRQTAFTRTRKFPYEFYDPSMIPQQNHDYHHVQNSLPKERRVSPWKKIIHLIGAILPFGLLLATLKPNLVNMDNTTQPNIVLSKLRVSDMPLEHKRARLIDAVQQDNHVQDTCDDRFICELIVGGSEPNSNLLQHILWNLTTKSTDEKAQKHGLEEIFAAAKEKNCSSLDC